MRVVVDKRVAVAWFAMTVFVFIRPLSLWASVRGNNVFDLPATLLFLITGLTGVWYYLKKPESKVQLLHIFFLASLVLSVSWNRFFNQFAIEEGVDFFPYYYSILLHVVYFGWGGLFGFLMQDNKVRHLALPSLLYISSCLLYLLYLGGGGYSETIVDYRYSASYHFLGLSFSLVTIYALASSKAAKYFIFVLVTSFWILFQIGNKGAIASLLLAFFFCRFSNKTIVMALTSIGLVYFLAPSFLYELTGFETILGRQKFDASGFDDIYKNGGVFAGQVYRHGVFGAYMHNFFSYFRQFGVVVWLLLVFVVYGLLSNVESRADKMVVIFFVSQVLFFRTFANSLILFPVGYMYVSKLYSHSLKQDSEVNA
ncbi:hypothetical protein GP5015_418 [gamma proteobacterium HTCC5015]|nr:hypothetical protein GP5015_418 [gamma proteobacterium HTCC5015]